MRAVKEWVCRTLWGTLDERRRRGLVRLYDTLAATEFHRKYWMNGGLLLGCIRDGGPLPHDSDADFSFWEDDLDRFERAVPALRRHGFKLCRKKVCNDGKVRKWAFKRQGMKYEFYLMERRENAMYWISHARKRRLELHCQVPLHGLNEIALYERQWLKPDDHETYLESLYGNWRKPDPGYCYWRDSRAIIATQSWMKRTA